MMAYAQGGLVAAILINKKPIRESLEGGSRICRVPFDTEYMVRLKNKSKGRAYATVEIDGMNVSPGREFILHPGQTLDLERFITDGDLDSGKRFKFMSILKGAATGEIQDPTDPNNGLIRVTFKPEFFTRVTTTLSGTSTFKGGPGGQSILRGRSMNANPINYGNSGFPGDGQPEVQNLNSNVGIPSAFYNAPVGQPSCFIPSDVNPTVFMEPQEIKSDAGATAEGSVSNQKFQSSSEWFATDTPVVIDLWLKGPKPQPRTDWVFRNRNGQPEIIFKGMYLEGISESQITNEGLVLKIPTVSFE